LLATLLFVPWPHFGCIYELSPVSTRACREADEDPIVGPIAIALDRPPDRAHRSIAAAHRTTDGRVHIEVGPYETDSCSPAAVVKPLLGEAEIEAVISNASDLAITCGGLVDAVHAEAISQSGQQVLGDAVASAVKRDLPGGFARDRTAGGSIAPASRGDVGPLGATRAQQTGEIPAAACGPAHDET
jgi:hypothetical protein